MSTLSCFIHGRRAPILLGVIASACVAAVHAATPTASTHYSVVDRIAGPSGGWDYTTIDPSVDRLYLARDSGVLSMDLRTHKITPVAVKGEGVHIALPVGDTGRVLVTNGDANTVTIFQASTNRVVGTVKVGNTPDAAVYDPSTKLVAVMNHRGGTVSLVDASKATLVRTIRVGGELEFAAPSGDGKLFLNVASQHEVAVLDLDAGKVLHRYVMKGCEDPSGLAYDAADGWIASVCGNGVTKILRASTGREVASLKTGFGSDGLIWDAARKLLFVPAPKEEQLTVVALGPRGAAVVGHVKTGPGARLGAVDPGTGLLYLPSAKMGPPKPPDPWPTVIPGTFAILVVGAR
jgi:YVTN family beta-propeller protein